MALCILIPHLGTSIPCGLEFETSELHTSISVTSDARAMINPISYCPCHVVARFGKEKLANATCFFGQDSQYRFHIITNWHVVTGRHFETTELLDREFASVPDNLLVRVRSLHSSNDAEELVIPLYDEQDQPLWYEHPKHGRRMDVVAIPLKVEKGWSRPALQMALPDRADILIAPTERVTILGFPLGESVDGLPVWTTGFIASEPSANYKNLPCMLIDSRTRQPGTPPGRRSNGSTEDRKSVV